MKIIFVSLWMLLIANTGMAGENPQARRNESCEVVSVTGEWAMKNFPRGIDIYFQELVEKEDRHRKWRGFITMAFSSNDRNFPLDKVVLDTAQISWDSADGKSATTVTRNSGDFILTERSYDFSIHKTVYDLKYGEGSGVYHCARAWPMRLPH